MKHGENMISEFMYVYVYVYTLTFPKKPVKFTKPFLVSRGTTTKPAGCPCEKPLGKPGLLKFLVNFCWKSLRMPAGGSFKTLWIPAVSIKHEASEAAPPPPRYDTVGWFRNPGANHVVSIVDLPLGNGSGELHPTGDCLAFLKHHLRSVGLYKINKQSCYTKKIHSFLAFKVGELRS